MLADDSVIVVAWPLHFGDCLGKRRSFDFAQDDRGQVYGEVMRMGELVTPDPLERYLSGAPLIDVDHEAVVAKTRELIGADAIETARNVFHFVRDDVAHSADIGGSRVTRSASDVLTYREGICYAKSHLAAALLRNAGIPSGICYQRLTLATDDSEGYCIHALNTAYIATIGRWIRFDARGNKPGVDARFSLDEEHLAFAIRPQYDEVDYLVNHAEPHPLIVATLSAHESVQEMYWHGLPDAIP